MNISKLPTNSQPEYELKSMMLQLGSEEIADVLNSKNSLDFSTRLQSLGMLTEINGRDESRSFRKSTNFLSYIETNKNSDKKIRKNTLINYRKNKM